MIKNKVVTNKNKVELQLEVKIDENVKELLEKINKMDSSRKVGHIVATDEFVVQETPTVRITHYISLNKTALAADDVTDQLKALQESLEALGVNGTLILAVADLDRQDTPKGETPEGERKEPTKKLTIEKLTTDDFIEAVNQGYERGMTLSRDSE